MIPINRTYAPVQAFVEELARCGMTHAITSPGSRNAPLALVLAAQEDVEARSVVDERAAGFVALGLAKASGRPVAVTCTSGSAAANLLPAVVEAHEARVPLIVLTADRPPELREVGAGQSIDQVKLYGSHAKWFVEVGNHDPSRATAVHHRSLACRAYWTAAGGRPGPVHLNFPLREPLAPRREELEAADWAGREDGRPWVTRLQDAAPRARAGPTDAAPGAHAGLADPLPGAHAGLAGAVAGARRGAIVCGAVRGPAPLAALDLARRAGWPVLADALSRLRCGPADRANVIAHYDLLLRAEEFASGHRPDLVIRVGDTPTSKPLRAWLAGAEQIVLDPDGAWHEPTREAATVVAAGPDLLGALGERAVPADAGWLESWQRADRVVLPELAATPDPFEPKVWAAVADAAPPGATLWVASSMPIRDVEAFLPSMAKPLRVLSNRGANGIDGTIASAAGAALAGGGPVYVLLGDVALLHDVGGLLAAARLGAGLTVVCANNRGGNIFDHLPVAGVADRAAYEEHIVTPDAIDPERAAALAAMPYTRAGSLDELTVALGRGPGLIEVPTDRARNVELHRDLRARVEAAL
ncbi:MAG TPA: 2-succinyl-5-enolpyruvyl-6-hydroxy-3-cyclohexene-1-carboxylic-acid synthase [Thermoleophilaceae bacterium]|jgi:2-succinyl-5-enolpyruvyl-6-hydroxy-3-cyclohexene-1-carboxylate synthase